MRKNFLSLSTEAIMHQDGTLFRELTVIFEEFVAAGNFTTKALEATPIRTIIKEKMGLTVDLAIIQNHTPNAYVVPPQITTQHPLVADFYRKLMNPRDGKNAIMRANTGVLNGAVDRAKGRVTGDYSTFVSDVYFTSGLFTSNVGLTAAELAGALLHELGHVFTYFECLTDQLRTNYQIKQSIDALLGTGELVTRGTIVRDIETAMELKLDAPMELANANDPNLIQVILVNAKIKALRSEYDSYYYDLRNWESLADQFAARHQAHLAVVTGLDKMYRFQGHSSTMSTPRFLLGQVGSAVKVICGVVINPFYTIASLLQDPFLDTYDKPVERMQRIRQDLVSALKDPNTGEREKAILEDLKAIDFYIAQLKDRNSFWEAAWKFLSPTIRGQQSRIQDLKALETLANNELYVHAAALRNL